MRTFDDIYVPDRCWYYLLDWNDSDKKETLFKLFNTYSLFELTVVQFWTLFYYATQRETKKV